MQAKNSKHLYLLCNENIKIRFCPPLQWRFLFTLLPSIKMRCEFLFQANILYWTPLNYAFSVPINSSYFNIRVIHLKYFNRSTYPYAVISEILRDGTKNIKRQAFLLFWSHHGIAIWADVPINYIFKTTPGFIRIRLLYWNTVYV